MRPDLQELEITLGELKRLSGLECGKSDDNKIYFIPSSARFFQAFIWLCTGLLIWFMFYMIVATIISLFIELDSSNLFTGLWVKARQYQRYELFFYSLFVPY